MCQIQLKRFTGEAHEKRVKGLAVGTALVNDLASGVLALDREVILQARDRLIAAREPDRLETPQKKGNQAKQVPNECTQGPNEPPKKKPKKQPKEDTEEAAQEDQHEQEAQEGEEGTVPEPIRNIGLPESLDDALEDLSCEEAQVPSFDGWDEASQ